MSVSSDRISNYIASFSPQVQQILQQLRGTIQEAAPQAQEVFSYSMPAFKINKILVHFAAYKRHIGLYPSPSAIEYFKEELKDYKTSKGAIQFPIHNPLPLSLITKIVQYRVKEDAAKTKKTYPMISPLYPCLWMDGKAKEAAQFYCSVFPQSAILSENPMVVVFQLNGAKFMCLNGGPEFKFTEAVSYVIECETQEEIDHYWNQLTLGGEEGKCGWLKDKFGMSWQVVPKILGKLMNDPEKAPKAMYAFMQMKKFDIAKLLQAAG